LLCQVGGAHNAMEGTLLKRVLLLDCLWLSQRATKFLDQQYHQDQTKVVQLDILSKLFRL
jgi:hypothetical protein